MLALGCGGAPAGTPLSTPAVTLDIAADNLQFDRAQLTAPADAPFAIRFENRESAPHNVSIHGDGAVFVGEIFSDRPSGSTKSRRCPPGSTDLSATSTRT